jgi:hypothetical protein
LFLKNQRQASAEVVIGKLLQAIPRLVNNPKSSLKLRRRRTEMV